MLVQYGVDVGLSGHEHFYERIVPQRGIQYFMSGGGGALRRGDIRDSALTAAGFDTDTHFMLIEISGDTLYFQVISRTGQTVDQGAVRAQPARDAAASATEVTGTAARFAMSCTFFMKTCTHGERSAAGVAPVAGSGKRAPSKRLRTCASVSLTSRSASSARPPSEIGVGGNRMPS